MKILMLSIDSSILRDGSEVQERMKEYGTIADELHIILYTEPGFSEKRIAENVWIYPTNTVAKPLYFFNAYRIGKRLIRSRPDLKTGKVGLWAWLITSQDAFTNIIAFCLKKKFGIPFQAQIHTDFLSPFFKSESLKNYVRYLIYCWSVKKSDCIRVVSERIKASLVLRFKIRDSKISVLPIFVDVEKIKNQQPSINLHQKYPGYDFIILMASRITKEKNIETACKAMEEAAKAFPKVLLVVAGEGPLKKILKEKYENLADRPKGSLRGVATTKQSIKNGAKSRLLRSLLSLAMTKEEFSDSQNFQYPNIVFENSVPYDTLISYYKTADLLLVTSAYEGYGRTIIEALAAGLPVFSTDVGVATEMIRDGETGAIFKSHDSKEIASRISEVLLQNKLAGMKFKTYEFAKNFSMPSKEEYLQKMKEGFEICRLLT